MQDFRGGGERLRFHRDAVLFDTTMAARRVRAFLRFIALHRSARAARTRDSRGGGFSDRASAR